MPQVEFSYMLQSALTKVEINLESPIDLTTSFSQEEDFFLDFPPSKVNMERTNRQQSQRKLLIMKFVLTII